MSNGILFGLVITRPRREWLAYFLAGLAADTLADVAYGHPFRIAIGVSLVNSVEVLTSCLVLTRWFEAPYNLSKLRPDGVQTVSISVAALVPEAGVASSDLVNLADRALYGATANGRNCVLLA